MSKGYVYILINPAFPRYLKIGKTTREPEVRAKELSSGTETPGKFEVAFDEFVDNCDLVEQLTHEKLSKYRISKDREFFSVNYRLAVETILNVITEINKQGKINFLEMDKFTWWNSLDDIWKQVFKSHIDFNIEPDESEILETLSFIIYDSQDTDLRKEVIKLVENRSFKEKIKRWYETLSLENQRKFNTYLRKDITEDELDQILNLQNVQCFNHPEIIDLSPLIKLENLRVVNCKDTKITSLEPLKNNTTLREIDCSYTKIDSLEPISKLPNLEIIYCYNTQIPNISIEILKKENPSRNIKNILDEWVI